MDEIRIWETFNCKDIEDIIKGNLRTIDEKFAQITASFVTNGYYLRRQLDEKMYAAEGYVSFEEYVKNVYGKSRSWAKRMMQINEKFSIGGNDPRIDKRYVEYSVSQLQEMLYLETNQLGQVTPDMTVKEIREVRKPEGQEKIVEVHNDSCDVAQDSDIAEEQIPKQMNAECYPKLLSEGEKAEEISCPPGQSSCLRQEWGSSPSEQHEGAKECAKCWNDWKKTQNVMNEDFEAKTSEESIVVDEDGGEVVAEVECQEVEDADQEEESEEMVSLSDMKILQGMIERENKMLRDMQECYTDDEFCVRQQKILIAALAGLMCEWDEAEPMKQIQPELPQLKNNDQRKKFLESYETWPIWFEVKEASEVYYRFDLPDDSSIVICEYYEYRYWKEKYTDETPVTRCRKEFLLRPEYKYLHDCETNTTALIEHLKNVQKGK